VRFLWDADKARENRRKHGVTFTQAVTAFEDPLAHYTSDPAHPERGILVGETARGLLVVVVHEERGSEAVRIISARRATRHERRQHEEDD
jgi:uncharacterized protein